MDVDEINNHDIEPDYGFVKHEQFNHDDEIGDYDKVNDW